MPEERGTTGTEPTTFNLLFVCSGNTCRSPMAMAIARRALAARGWTHVEARSAGTFAAVGVPASEHAVRVAAEHGLHLESHAAQPLTRELVDWADLILVMSRTHLGVIEELGAAEKAALITDFVEGAGFQQPVDDPFGGPEDAYRRTYDQLEQAVDGLLARLATILAP